MLGCAFFVTLIGALGGAWSGYVALVSGLMWLAKMIFMAWVEGAFDEEKPKPLMQFGINSGVEGYSPQPLAVGKRCKVIVIGMDRSRHAGASQTMLDAVYLMRGGQYGAHHGLLLDGSPATPFQEDLYEHCYAFPCTGTGQQLSIFLRLPQGIYADPDYPRKLEVTIWTLSAKEEAEVKALEEKRQREATAIQHEELKRRALELATAAHLGSNFLKEDYQQNYARKFMSKVLDRLGPDWLADYREVLADEALSAIINELHPHVLPFLEARLQVIRAAECLVVEPPSELPARDPKSRLTPEEWQARIERYRQRALTRKRVKVEDFKADVMQDLALLQEFIADLDSYPLDEDERDRFIQEFKERMLGSEEENNNGYRQL